MALTRFQVNDALTNLVNQAGLELVNSIEVNSGNAKSTITYDALNDLAHQVSDALGLA